MLIPSSCATEVNFKADKDESKILHTKLVKYEKGQLRLWTVNKDGVEYVFSLLTTVKDTNTFRKQKLQRQHSVS